VFVKKLFYCRGKCGIANDLSYPLFLIYTGLPTGHLLARRFVELFFDPEDGGDTFLLNVGYNSTDYTASYPRR
jgi:hypothetical protein